MAFASSFRKAAVVFTVTSFAVFGASSVVTGCSSSSDEASEPDAGVNNCPTTLDVTIGQACNSVTACVVGFVCPMSLNQTAICNCVNKTWSCSDGQGNPITDPSATANCKALGGGNDKDCPASEAAASFASCKTPGLLCNYAGLTCPGASVAKTDTCQCQGNDADGGLQYRCTAESCLGPPVEAGIMDAGGDH